MQGRRRSEEPDVAAVSDTGQKPSSALTAPSFSAVHPLGSAGLSLPPPTLPVLPSLHPHLLANPPALSKENYQCIS